MSATPPFKRIALIGLGLIGSSLARGIQQLGLAGELVATDNSAAVRARAVEIKLADRIADDNASAVTLENLVKAAQQSEVLIYAVGLLGEEERREAQRAQRALKALATATGGDVYFPKDANEVEKIAHQVARDIRNQYTIAYTPTNTAMDGTFRQIKIMVRAPGNPTVRTRTGYYATPDQAAPSGAAGKVTSK